MEITDAISEYGYYLYYFFLVAEGQPIYWLGGFFLSIGIFKLWPLILGLPFLYLGDYLFYLLGQRVGSKLIAKYGKYIFLTENRVEFIRQLFHKHKRKTVFIGAFIYGIGHNALLVFGATGGRYKDIIGWSIVGSTLSYFMYLALGFYLGEGYGYTRTMLKEAGIVILIVLVVMIFVGQVIYEKRKEKKSTFGKKNFN
ncbi:MAG: hypothetical protein NUV82_01490 [Candidatus Komeilibacteria bacterium]|nr:hypothetical protein [Candidatus Komeilibacteria bacterium]